MLDADGLATASRAASPLFVVEACELAWVFASVVVACVNLIYNHYLLLPHHRRLLLPHHRLLLPHHDWLPHGLLLITRHLLWVNRIAVLVDILAILVLRVHSHFYI